jgi:hypothetical protein
MNKIIRNGLIAFGCILAAGFVIDDELKSNLVVQEAEARIGKPATPRSVAGVARRTTRRRVRRTTRYVAILPRGCTRVVVNGNSLYQCGVTYYQARGGQYVVVYVD